MKKAITVSALVIILSSVALALPLPGTPQIEYGCGSVILHWSPPEAGQHQLDGYYVYKMINNQNWELLSQNLITDTTFTDQTIILNTSFNYGVIAMYSDGQSDLRPGISQYLPDPSGIDYLLVGNDDELELNNWYRGILESLGLHGEQVSSILPYCGDALRNLRLLWLGEMGDDYPSYRNTPEDLAIIDYLEQGGRLYMDDAYDYFSDTLSYRYLGYGITACMSYPFLSAHGISNTFTEGLWYRFTDSLWSSNMVGRGEGVYNILEDDVECGCVDLAIDKQGFKAVVNSQPLYRAIDNDDTGTRLEYFRRVLVFFDILSDIKDRDPRALPDQITLSAYPNPFNSQVTLNLSGPDNDISVNIYDITGRMIKGLPRVQGNSVIWDGKTDQGLPVTSGVYFARAISGVKTASAKLTLLK